MTNYDETNKGALFINKKAGAPQQPDFTGQINVEGVEYWVSCWDNVSGQGMPYILGTAVGETQVAANMSLNMYAGLTHGAYSAIHAHGTDEQKATYLPKMVTCDWTGTI